MFNFAKYILALIKGLSVTFKHIFKKPVTDRYPKKKREMLPRYRGLHYLARYDNGKERCVCCGLCAAACPVECIYMEGEEIEGGDGVRHADEHVAPARDRQPVCALGEHSGASAAPPAPATHRVMT